MFRNEKYATQGIVQNIPVDIQTKIWDAIYGLDFEPDYLQVFTLEPIIKNGAIMQKITHEQEEPEYRKEFVVPTDAFSVVTTKIFVIDDLSHSTILLASEY